MGDYMLLYGSADFFAQAEQYFAALSGDNMPRRYRTLTCRHIPTAWLPALLKYQPLLLLVADSFT